MTRSNGGDDKNEREKPPRELEPSPPSVKVIETAHFEKPRNAALLKGERPKGREVKDQ